MTIGMCRVALGFHDDLQLVWVVQVWIIVCLPRVHDHCVLLACMLQLVFELKLVTNFASHTALCMFEFYLGLYYAWNYHDFDVAWLLCSIVW